jgi:tetratricopeptide (TPR) repeat protein
MSSMTKPHPSPHVVMTAQWNTARAGVLASLAKEQFEGGNLDKARETIDQAIALDPKTAGLHLLSAKIALEKGQLDLAQKELQLTQLQDPHIAEADYLMGVVYQRWQQPDQAFQQYQNAEAKAPTELAYVLASAEMLVEMNRNDEALVMLQDKATDFEHSSDLHDEIGELLAGKGKFADAVKSLRQASLLAPEDQTIREHLSLALYFDKDYREACDLFTKLLNDDKFKQRVDLILAQGECYEQTGRLDDAKASFESATQISPGTPEAWISLGKISLEKNDLRRAEMALRKAGTLDPTSGQPPLMLGYIRLREGRPNDAMPFFKKASALNQSDPVSLCMIGYLNEKAGRTELAIQCYAKALKLHPGDELATRLMASVDTN